MGTNTKVIMSVHNSQIYPTINQQPAAMNQPVIQQPLPTVVTSQPVPSTVVINQGPVVINGKQAWRAGLCDCGHNLKHCLCGFFCTECYAGCQASRMDESCCMGFCLGPTGLMAMRAYLRGKHSLEGDICSDCCVTHCCYMCAVCQTAVELDAQGYKQ